MSQSDDTRVITTPAHEERPNAGRAPIKVAHLVFGCFFLGVAALWALTESGNLTWKGTSYLVPLTLLLAGAIGLAASLIGNTGRRRASTTSGPAPVATTTHDAADTTAEDTTVLPADETEER